MAAFGKAFQDESVNEGKLALDWETLELLSLPNNPNAHGFLKEQLATAAEYPNTSEPEGEIAEIIGTLTSR